jgi:hypothetical protein
MLAGKFRLYVVDIFASFSKANGIKNQDLTQPQGYKERIEVICDKTGAAQSDAVETIEKELQQEMGTSVMLYHPQPEASLP